MVDPASQDLYIMQNEFGLIKIGRSVDVQRRRWSLRTSERCRIEIVEVFGEAGDLEERLHIRLNRFRLAGEWFDGTERARKAIIKALGLGEPLDWPFAHDREGAANWLEHIRVVRAADAINREVYREITILRDAKEPSWVYDIGIFFVKFRAATGRKPHLSREKADGGNVTRWIDPETREEGIVPEFTSRLQTALMVWPDDLRPDAWDGSPIECCIAALSAIRQRLPRVERASTREV